MQAFFQKYGFVLGILAAVAVVVGVVLAFVQGQVGWAAIGPVIGGLAFAGLFVLIDYRRYGYVLGIAAVVAWLVGLALNLGPEQVGLSVPFTQAQVTALVIGFMVGGVALGVLFVLTDLESYGYLLGYTSLAGLLAGVIRLAIGTVLGLASGGIQSALADGWTQGVLIGGALLGLLYILLHPAQVKEMLTRRSTRYGSSALLTSIAFVGILIGLNYLAGRYHYQYDATDLKLHTLSDQTLEILEQIDQPMEIYGFFTANDPRKQDFDKWLDQYLYASDELSYTVIDPDREPIRARQYRDPPPESSLLIQVGERTEAVYVADEQSISSAILRVLSDQDRVIYFLTGHQEREPEGPSADSCALVASILRDLNYEVRTLNLLITDTVPSDATVLVAAGPQVALAPEELERLETYLLGGGKALLMQDPFTEANLNQILSRWQVGFGEGLIIDPLMYVTSPSFPVTARYGRSQVTKDLERVTTFFPEAGPVEQAGETPAPGVTFTPLAQTSQNSWAEMNSAAAEVMYDAGEDVGGPLTLAASVEVPAETGDPEQKTRLVLVGDSDFAADEFAESPGNARLFVNAINWLAEEEDLVAIGAKIPQTPRAFLTSQQQVGICLVSVFLVPGGLLVAAVAVWWRRR